MSIAQNSPKNNEGFHDPRRYCPNAPECRKRWQTLPGRDDVVVCSHYYQWLERSTLARILASAA